MKSVVVTGSSTGIGWGCVKVLTGAGYHVFGSVRKEEDGARLREEFGKHFTPLLFDVTDAQAVARGAAQVGEALGSTRLAGLVNNAGIAVFGPLAHQPVDDFRQQLEVNVVGQIIVTQAFLPLLGMDATRTGDPGRIINMSSIGGKMGAPFLGAYAASKFALEGVSDSLRRELDLYGIDVIIIGPGAVATPIWGKAEDVGLGPYEGTDYEPALQKFADYFLEQGRSGFPPEKLGRAVLNALTARKPKWRYAVVPGYVTNWLLPNLLPRRMVDRLICGRLGLTRK